jgi:DNA-binding transcriptional LysR family regulator
MIKGDEPTARQLQLLLTLAEELHFGRAAARLYLTQPALSQQIRALEQKLGVQLFERTSRRVELTDTGAALLPLARSVVEATDELGRVAHASAREGRLQLGVCESFGALDATRSVIATISAQFPDLGPDVQVVDVFIDQVSELRDGQIDAAFVHFPVPDDLCAEPLFSEPRVACVADSDPLAQRTSVRLADLAEYPVISTTPKTFRAGREFWAADPRPDGKPVRYSTHQVARFESLLSTVALGGATAFVPAASAQLYSRPDIRYLTVEDLPGCTFGVAWRAADHDKPKIVALRKACAAYAGTI